MSISDLKKLQIAVFPSPCCQITTDHVFRSHTKPDDKIRTADLYDTI